MSMLAEPNTESPANVDAAKMWREDRWAAAGSVLVWPSLAVEVISLEVNKPAAQAAGADPSR